MKAKQLQQRNYTIGIPQQYEDNQNLYTISTVANNGSSLMGGIGGLLDSVLGGIADAVLGGMDMINRRRQNENATALAQDSLSNSGNTTTTILICAALVIVVYFYFKK